MELKSLEQYAKTHQPIAGVEDISHYWDEQSLYAVIAAVAAGKPLLVRGEPGTGKSQLARAAAHILNRQFISVVVQPYLEAQDLLWSMDYTARLADSQLGEDTRDTIADLSRYLCAGPVWWAIDPATASVRANSRHQYTPPNESSDEGSGTVLLIDEIDKADIAIANSLLEVMADGGFSVPHLADRVAVPTGGVTPLIVFTSNDTRELPAAFVRRCATLWLKVPNDLEAHLIKLGRERYPQIHADCLSRAAALIREDRSKCRDGARTGIAEYMDLLRALDELTTDVKDEDKRGADQDYWLDKISAYSLKSDLGG